jgi:hypothetical protein
MHPILRKKIHPLITYPVLVFFSVFLVITGLFFTMKSEVGAQYLLPFEGRIVRIEYNCLCSLSVLLQVQPTVYSRQGQQAQTYIFFYGPQLMEIIAGWLGIEPPDLGDIVDIGAPIPRLYMWYMIWNTGNQTLLGNYVPGSFPCVAYTGNSCSVTEYAGGAIFNVGTSLF